MNVWQKYKMYILHVVLALAVGGVSALLSGGMEDFETLVKPPLAPPGWLFPVVWSILYVLMGIAAGLIEHSGDRRKKAALIAYYVQLAINFWWSPIFFGLGWIGFAAVWLASLVVAVYVTRQRFRVISPAAGWLLLPYLLWCLFALYLNVGFVILN